MEGVKSGQYYAAIVVPEKFSTQMMSLFSDQILKPEIIYYSNAKENAIAPKVTDKGATATFKFPVLLYGSQLAAILNHAYRQYPTRQ